MPLSKLQKDILRILAKNRHAGSHLAGASAIHASPSSPRYSGDLDLFHDDEKAVADAFALDEKALKDRGLSVEVQLSQPGFIRAIISEEKHSVLIDWAQDSAWRFMPTVEVDGIGTVLHPVDLAINKVLALAGREEPRDWLDILYLDQNLISLGAMAWAAVGKDPGLNPVMLLELLSRKGRVTQHDLDRLDLDIEMDLGALHTQWRSSLNAAKKLVNSRPANEAGCLYIHPESGLFFTPDKDATYHLHPPSHGGILPRFTPELSIAHSVEAREQLERFFGQTITE